jgi:pyruvate dehydrogenase (quinone)
MTYKVADIITELLHSTGVRRVYGIVGDSLNGITRPAGKIRA